MRISLGIRRVLLLTAATFVAVGVAGPAYADGGAVYNNAQIDIHGGNASAFSGCLKLAKETAKRGGTVQSNACKNFAKASGGTVQLIGVSIFVDQEGSGRKTHNNVEIDISGGDATAVAACVNFMQGSASSSQKNECANSATATGGSVKLEHVDIVVIQLG